MTRLVIRRGPPQATWLPSSDALRGRVVRAIRRARHLAWDPATGASPTGYHLTVAVQAGKPTSEEPLEEQIEAAIWLAGRRVDHPDAPPVEIAVMIPARPQHPVLATRIGRAVDQAVADMDFQTGLAEGPPAAVVGELRRPGSDRQLLWAVDAAARRRIRAAVPQLIKLLKHADQQIADRAIGALVNIGDRTAVAPLARVAKFRDTEKLAKVIDGIATLGGSEARSYLELVIGGHPDADIQRMAKEALSRMNRPHGPGSSSGR